MDHDDLEPIDLEPIDLEPVDPAHAADDARYDRDRPRNRSRRASRAWFAVVGAGLAAWATIALTADHRHDRATTPTPTPTSIPTPSPGPAPPVDAIRALSPRLWAGLRGIGSGRFAVVAGDRLYLLDEATTESETTLVPLPEGHVSIDDQNGSSLLARTFQATLVSTTSTSAATRVLSARDTPIKAIAPQQWWLLRADGTIRDEHVGAPQRVPTGLRIVGAVEHGFVGIAPPDFRWVLWSGSTTRTIAPPGYQLLATGSRTVVFKYGCGYNGCSVAIVDLDRRTVVRNTFRSAPEYAALAPDGSRLALASNQGNILILDPSTGAVVTEERSVSTGDVALPLTWTPDSRTLLVVGNHDVKILRGSDGAPMGVVTETDGLQQLFALP